MPYIISIGLSVLWGIGCGLIIPNPFASLAVSIVGGFAIGYFLPPLLGA